MLRWAAVIGLESYAVALAWMQSLGGVRTDEAKYLLNIPYPHPPLARWIFSLTETLPFQEWFWRVVLATLVVQAVWLVWSMTSDLPRRARLALSACWLLSAAVVLQAGTVMMAPLTGLQGLLFVWLWRRPRETAAWAALLWLCALFTAYQGVLYLPLLLAVLRRSKKSWLTCLLIAGVPMGLAAMYALGNPLSLASFVNAGGDNAGKNMMAIVSEFNAALAIGGSIVLVLTGLWGMGRAKAWPLFLTFLLLAFYNFASVHLYYAVLFTPVLIGGTAFFLKGSPRFAWPLTVLTVLGTGLLFVSHHPSFTMANTRVVVRELNLNAGSGDLLVNGSFGHDWQYESPVPVRRFVTGALGSAQAVVCIVDCPDLTASGFTLVETLKTEAYRK